MTGPLLETKLFLPSARAGIVQRPRLSKLLSRSLPQGCRLVLLSAPAGFGKTTLLTSWFAPAATRAGDAAGRVDDDAAVAWVALDEGDQDASSFWTYVVTALDRAVPGVGAAALPLLRDGRDPPEGLLAEILNELSVRPHRTILVLDDYHLADGPDVGPGMTLLVDHLPPRVCLVISTRADPALPLARLRARGELTEIRAADLRFTLEEAATYLDDVPALRLTPADIAALEERTEGWIAALKLAALSLQGRADAAGFIAGFAGDDRFVVDYLVEEVLERQPEPVRRFLLETSILDRLTGPLCDAVTGGSGGRLMLERVDRGNLFLVPLDDQRRWYRYHHLFADLLRSRLLAERPSVADLHRRASSWYDQAGEPVAAVRHALAGGDIERAADLVELAVPELRRNRAEATLRRWIDQVPDHVVARRPVLAMGFVGALMAGNEFDDVERRLRVIERSLDSPGATAGDAVVVDQAELARLPGGLELYRAALALIGGDPANTVTHARRAVDLAPEHDDLTRASAAALSGLASWTLGDLDGAHRAYTDAAHGLGRLGHLADLLGCSIALADIETTQGGLRQAEHTYAQALRLAATHDPRMRGTRDMHTGLSLIALERNDLTGAAEHLSRGEELGDAAGLPQNPYRWRVATALLRESEGDRDAALALLAEAERRYVADFSPDVRPVPAMRARVLAGNDDLPGAIRWVQQAGLSPDDNLSYLREYEHVALAHVLLAQHAADGKHRTLSAAIGLLTRLLRATEAAGRHGTVIEVLALLALAHRAAGDDTRAAAALDRALVLAEPEGFVRVFVRAGQPMVRMLTAADRARPGRPFLRRLLGAARPEHGGGAAEVAPGDARAPLAEALTDRERDVMRPLASELDGPSIARELVLSLNTVRTHTKNIYAKLGVTNRRAAVARAHQLNLITRTGHR